MKSLEPMQDGNQASKALSNKTFKKFISISPTMKYEFAEQNWKLGKLAILQINLNRITYGKNPHRSKFAQKIVLTGRQIYPCVIDLMFRFGIVMTYK